MAYHHALACISSALPSISRQGEYIISRRLYPLSQWWYTRLSPWWYTTLRVDDTHAFRRDLVREFKSIQKLPKISFLSAFHNKKRTFVYRQRCVFWMMFAKVRRANFTAKWWRLRLMMFATRMMCALRHIGANIASLRNEVEQHHFCEANASYRRKAMHHLTNKRFRDIIAPRGDYCVSF